MLGNNNKMKQKLYQFCPLYLAKKYQNWVDTQWTTLLFQRQECYTNDLLQNEEYLYIIKRTIVYNNNYNFFMHT